ncbi:Retrovirus-related Pol polyprotein from transposon 17.6 [Gossypium australe]|uniref:Retrovirus-related Pol polyprotein from transposon 17.6 n=1 Tax=Gossypium australe TaxID=47621 RepID=A0A5B6WZY1_9ROSI|nr:Retrovirus-related Pol polyprotein from transposon 17.6 [Gossypium australe]
MSLRIGRILSTILERILDDSPLVNEIVTKECQFCLVKKVPAGDASLNDLSCVLIHTRRNPPYDLELAVVVFTLKIWGHYLYGGKCHRIQNNSAYTIHLGSNKM